MYSELHAFLHLILVKEAGHGHGVKRNRIDCSKLYKAESVELLSRNRTLICSQLHPLGILMSRGADALV